MNLKKTAKRFLINGPVKGAYLWYLNKRSPRTSIDSIRVHAKASLAEGVRIAHDVRIGADVSMGCYSYVMPYSIVLNAEIGKYCSIGSYVSIGGWQHPYRYITTSPAVYRDILGLEYDDTGKRVIIGDDVWIADGAIILAESIGHGAVIAAGAVVTKNVPAYEIWAGVPAKKIGRRFPEDVDPITQIEWTSWSSEQMKKRANLFSAGENWQSSPCISNAM